MPLQFNQARHETDTETEVNQFNSERVYFPPKSRQKLLPIILMTDKILRRCSSDPVVSPQFRDPVMWSPCNRLTQVTLSHTHMFRTIKVGHRQNGDTQPSSFK